MSKDLLTGEKIRGKNSKVKSLLLFNNRRNMIGYFLENAHDPIIIEETAQQLFKNQKELKNLVYNPSTVELRSSLLPTVQLLKKYDISFDELCKNVSLQHKFVYDKIPEIKKTKLQIWQDTREQKPIRFSNITKKTSLAFGDYICPNKPNICIERKSLLDLVSTISQGYDRFQKELKRAKENNVYIFVLIESNLNQSLSFNYLPQMKFVKATPDFIFGRIGSLLQEFDNCQFVFCKGRNHLKLVGESIFQSESPESFDWQYLIDTKFL